MGRDLALGLSAGLSTTSASDDARFGSQMLQLSPSLTFPVSEFGRLSVRGTLSRGEIRDVNAAASPRIIQDAALGAQITSSVGFTYTHDTRTNGTNPDRGTVKRTVLVRPGQTVKLSFQLP